MNNVISNNRLHCTVALDALQDVMDPEIGLNIVDLGLIYQVDFDEPGQKIFCLMTLTTQFCPMGESITDAAERVLEDSFPGYEIIVNLTFDPPWTYERISVTGKQFLNS